MTNKDKQHVTTLVPTNVHVITSLPTHIPRNFDHQPQNGRQLGDSLGGNIHGRDPLEEPPFNPPIGSFGWPTPNPCMFTPSWYQPLVVQLVLEPTTKLPYRKLQYPTYVKDTDPDTHIRVFKKAIKANGETMEANIINLFGFTLRDSIFEWCENYV